MIDDPRDNYYPPSELLELGVVGGNEDEANDVLFDDWELPFSLKVVAPDGSVLYADGTYE